MNKKQYSHLKEIIEEIGSRKAINSFYSEIDRIINTTKGNRQKRYKNIKNIIQEIDDQDGLEILLKIPLTDLTKRYGSNQRAIRDTISTFYYKTCKAINKETANKEKRNKKSNNKIRLPKYNYMRL